MKMNRSYASGLRIKGCIVLATGLFALLPLVSEGATTYTLQIEGLPQSDVEAVRFGHSVSNTLAGTVVHNDLHIGKRVDAASPLLLQSLCATQAIPSVTFNSTEVNPDSTRYYKIRIKDVLVSSYACGLAANSPPTEEVTLNYTEIEWTYIQTGPDNTGLGASASTWDQSTGTGAIIDPDSDGDGIPDSYEVQEQLKPLVDDADDDDDDDGMSNKNEFDAGTRAGDPNSIFKVTGLTRPAAGGVLYTVTFNSVPDRTYQLHVAESLEDPFQPVHTVTATDPVTSVDLTLPQFRAFVKVTVLPQ